MIIGELITRWGECVIEQHETAAPFKVERLPGEIIIDLGKFSCAVALYRGTSHPRRPLVMSITTTACFAVAAFLMGLSIDPVEAAEWVARHWSRHP